MRLVARPSCRPMRCAAIPFIAQTTPNVRWVDTGSELDGFDNHVYLSDVAVREAGKVLGFPSRADMAELKRQLVEAQEQVVTLSERLAAVVDENEELRRFRQAVDVIESADFQARKKAGRPRKEVTA